MTAKPKMPLSIAVCDDECSDLKEIEALTKAILQEEKIECQVAIYENGTSLLSAMEEGLQFHILLLDVLMEQPDGMQVAASLRERGNRIPIIFLSVNREMAMQGYMVAASRYLAKPIERQLLREALLFCIQRSCTKKEILLKTTKGQSRILVSEILYAESWNRGIRLILTHGSEESHMKISELADILPSPPFVFCHRTILVNLSYVQHLRYCELDLKSGASLPVSKYRFADVRSSLLAHLRETI